jgi:hypothetical protein
VVVMNVPSPKPVTTLVVVVLQSQVRSFLHELTKQAIVTADNMIILFFMTFFILIYNRLLWLRFHLMS